MGDQVKYPVVQHGFAAPKVDQGPVTLRDKVFHQFEIPSGGNLLIAHCPDVLTAQVTIVAPLSSGVTTEITGVGDPETDLPNPAGLTVATGTTEEIEKMLFGFEGNQSAADPGMPSYPASVLQHHPDTDTASSSHDEYRRRPVKRLLFPQTVWLS